MKKNWFTKIKAIVIVFFSIALSISPFNPVKLVDTEDSGIVCAQDIGAVQLGTGVSCTPKKVCPDGSLYDNIVSGKIKALADGRGAALQALSTLDWVGGAGTFRDDEVCATNNLNGITLTQRQRALDNSGTNFLGIRIGGGISVSFIAGICNINNPTLQRVQIVGRGEQTICCPQNYTAAGTNYANGSHSTDYGPAIAGIGHLGCCPQIPGSRSTRLIYQGPAGASIENLTQECHYFSDTEATDLVVVVVESPSTQIYNDFQDYDLVLGKTFEELSESSNYKMHVTANLDIMNADDPVKDAKIIALTDELATLNDYLTSTCRNNPDAENIYLPEIGNLFDCRAYLLYTFTIIGNPATCPPNTCVQMVTGVVGRQDQLDTEYRNSTCSRCFRENEVIEGNQGTSGAELTICKPSIQQGEPVIRVAACNNSITDTIACLGGANAASQNAASEGIDSVNYTLCCDCRSQGGVWTGIGCTDTTPSGLITGLIRIIYGVMGGVALVMLIYAGIMYQTGNEANVKKARELIIQTVSGLVVLTFSILILRVIGINILDILPAGSI